MPIFSWLVFLWVVIFKRREGDLDALGRHILLELKDCNREVLNNLDLIQNVMISAAEEAGATILEKHFHHFSPQGVSGAIIIAESHLAVHTWPEYGYAALDIFTCGDSVKPEVAVEKLIKTLESKDPTVIELKRGFLLTEAVCV
ncbi:adenosylmethionine decarboxylase [Chloroflexota bacterium]